MDIHYLEIITTDIDSVCKTYSKLTGAIFDGTVEALGNARTANLDNGGRMGVRVPMHASESPTMRCYVLVDNVETAIQAAIADGAEVAHPPFELPGEGIFAIYSQGGVFHGLWQR